MGHVYRLDLPWHNYCDRIMLAFIAQRVIRSVAINHSYFCVYKQCSTMMTICGLILLKLVMDEFNSVVMESQVEFLNFHP